VRVIARATIGTPANRIVGRAHGDDRGEFVLVLRSEAALSHDPATPLRVQVQIFAPPPPAASEWAIDALGDVKRELLGIPSGSRDALDHDSVAAGETLPPDYAPLTERRVTFVLGRVRTDEPKFTP
jgi:hypothetical protein